MNNEKKFELFKLDFEQTVSQMNVIRNMSYNFFKQGIYLLFVLNGFAIIQSIEIYNNKSININISIYCFSSSIVISILICFISTLMYDMLIKYSTEQFNNFNSMKKNNEWNYMNFKKTYNNKIKNAIIIITILIIISIILFFCGVINLLN